MQNKISLIIQKKLWVVIGIFLILACDKSERNKTWNGSEPITCHDAACVTVGQYNLNSLFGGALALGAYSTDKGQTFTASNSFLLRSDMFNPDASIGTFGVTCDGQHCVTVGTYNMNILGGGVAFPFSAISDDGGKNFQANMVQPFFPLGTDTTKLSELVGVTCNGKKCVAVGVYNLNIFAGPIGGLPLVVTSNDGGVTFSHASQVQLPADADAVNKNSFLYGVSCSSATHCVGIGQYNWDVFTLTSLPFIVVSRDGENFTEPAKITLPDGANTTQFSKLRSIACKDLRCVAVGFYNAELIDGKTSPIVLISTDGGSTFTSYQPSLPADANPAQAAQLTGISCFENHCVIVGNYNVTFDNDGNPITGIPVVLVSDNSGDTFTPSRPIPLPSDTDLTKPVLLTGVHCDKKNCVTVGGYNLGYIFTNPAFGFPLTLTSQNYGQTFTLSNPFILPEDADLNKGAMFGLGNQF